MYSVSRSLIGLLIFGIATTAFATKGVLRVCADANNLPYSNSQEQGFENKLAEMVAHDLGRNLEYVWWPPNPEKAGKVFRAGACDLIMGVPSTSRKALPTHPYYSSSYVFVSRSDRHLKINSFDDPILRTSRIGLHLVGDGSAVPPARELASRGIVRNVVGYSIYGDSSKANPPAELIEAVARGDLDLAIAWGPLAGIPMFPCKLRQFAWIHGQPRSR